MNSLTKLLLITSLSMNFSTAIARDVVDLTKIKILNHINGCLDVKPKHTFLSNNKVMLTVDTNIINGDCPCMSGLSQFRSYPTENANLLFSLDKTDVLTIESGVHTVRLGKYKLLQSLDKIFLRVFCTPEP